MSIPRTSQEQVKSSIDCGGDESADSLTGECSFTSGRLSAADESDSQSGSCSSATHVLSTHRSAMYSMAYVQPSETLSDCLFADDEEDESLLDIDVGYKELSSRMEIDSCGSGLIQSSSYIRQPLSIATALNEVFDSSTQHEPSTLTPSLQDVKEEEEIEEEEALPEPEKSLFTRSSKISPIEVVKSKLNDRIKGLGGLPMGEYAEVKLLYTLRRALSSASEPPPASVYRLHRKLYVRKMKRERNLPVFNVDEITACDSVGWRRPNSLTSIGGPERILNRFKEVSHSASEALIQIDCLQYPDFSCVVLYRKLVIAFAVMVPDVRHNETYISFLFTRPEWRKAGIATFMLYHLI
ncbi:hypothetical protein J437_LFUL012093, partial [Ladona fulva]